MPPSRAGRGIALLVSIFLCVLGKFSLYLGGHEALLEAGGVNQLVSCALVRACEGVHGFASLFVGLFLLWQNWISYPTD